MATGSGFTNNHFYDEDEQILDDDFLNDDIEPDEPAVTSDRAPLTGEDRRAAQNTIDESVWDTVSRDLFAVWEKMKQVLWPKYLLGGMLQRAGTGTADAEQGGLQGFGRDVRGLVGRWPDTDGILQGAMSEGLRDWDLCRDNTAKALLLTVKGAIHQVDCPTHRLRLCHKSATKPASADARDNSPARDTKAPQTSSPTGSTSSREGEKKTREQLKQTSIAGLSQKVSGVEGSTDVTSTVAESDVNQTPSGSIRGRIPKKRSFEGVNKDETEADAGHAGDKVAKTTGHKRMRSRDVKPGEEVEPLNGSEVLDMPDASQEEIDAPDAPGGAAIIVEKPSQEDMDRDLQSRQSVGATTKSASEQSLVQPATVTAPSSGFANASSVSPFDSTKSPLSQQLSSEVATNTSSSAFASSGLSAFASSAKSPFEGVSPAKSGGFGGGQSTSSFGATPKGFGSASSNTFGGSGSAFGGIPKPFGSTSAFGASKAFGSTLAGGFGGGAAPSSFGSAKPFSSSSQPKDDEEANEEPEAELPVVDADTKPDERFHEQHIDTGEEGEETLFSCRAKLYFLERGVGWKDRGTGLLKINVREVEPLEASTDDDPSRTVKKARLIMRADGVHRVILNSPVFKGMRFGDTNGEEPTGKTMHLQSMENGEMQDIGIRGGRTQNKSALESQEYHLKGSEATQASGDDNYDNEKRNGKTRREDDSHDSRGIHQGDTYVENRACDEDGLDSILKGDSRHVASPVDEDTVEELEDSED
ncbi:hypothetical protein MRB53_040139 [Persea americana]|nr:hypothetical protein MRB53_040139 [Persea americana]